MSFLRYSRPGQPSVVVDQGPANGKGNARAAIGGAIVVSTVKGEKDRKAQAQRDYMARKA